MNTIQVAGHWIRAGVPSRAWVREGGRAGGTSVMMVEKNAILAEARRRLLLEKRETLVQIEMARLRKEAKESCESR
jgi:hypothetical protein